MYYEYFGLKKHPFRITPETQLFYSGAERGDILNALIYAVSSGEAITKVVGEVGTGKTMLCRMLELKLPDHIEIAYLLNPNIAPENILHAIALEMGLPIASDKTANRLEVMKALERYLLEKHAANHQVVVLIEEAQCMPLDTLEEIRLLSNLETQQHKLLQIVLFGQPELNVNLSAPRVRQIKERITNSFYLQPLSIKDIHNYLMFRLHLASYSGPDLFTKSAISLIGKASHGLMRRINILADKAMLAAFSQDCQNVTRKHVRIAIRDSEFGSQFRWFLSKKATAILTILAFSVAGLMTTHFIGHTQPTDISNGENPQVSVVSVLKTQLTPIEIVKNRMNQAVAWLENQHPSHFSIQVLFARADSISGLGTFFAQKAIRSDLDKLYIVQSTMNGKSVLGVFYGDFTTFSEADKALKALPDTLTRYRPYIRRIKAVKAEADVVSTERRS